MQVAREPVCVLLVLIIAFVSFVPLGILGGRAEMPQPHAPIFIDGLGMNNCPGQFCVQSQLLTTTRGHDVILLIVNTIALHAGFAIIDSSGLIFTQRLSYSSRWGYVVWEYYAIARSPLKSDNITIIASQCCYRIVGMQVLAVHGADANAIFDPNPSIPAAVSCPGPGCGDCTANFNQGTCSESMQTSTIDFVIASTAINDAGPCGPGYPRGVVPGFTNIVNQNNRFEVDYAITTTPHSNVVFRCHGTDAVAIVVDAISLHYDSDINSTDSQEPVSGISETPPFG